jgi:uncharacterized protein YdcH (DUF465 family)
MCRDCTEIFPWSGPQEVDFLRHFSSELLECRDSHFPKLNKKINILDGQYSIKEQNDKDIYMFSSAEIAHLAEMTSQLVFWADRRAGAGYNLNIFRSN